MHSSNRKHRRQRGNNGDEDERGPQLDVSDPYSHPRQYNHNSDTYRPTTSSARATYTTETSSRHHDEWRPADPSYSSHDRYSYAQSDVYRSRDEYDSLEPRDSDGWLDRSGDTHYADVGRGWGQRYDHSHSASSYPESSSWTYDDRGRSHDHWVAEDSRGGPSDERSHIRSDPEGNRGERETHAWRKNGRKDGRKAGGKDERRGGDPSTWRSDSGWESRRSENRGQAVMATAINPDSRPPVDDRSWEPAPSWQPQKRSGGQGHNNQKGSRGNQNKNSKGGKKGNVQNKQKRDWRTDDGNNLNNWPKRDTHDSPPRINRMPQKRRQQLSPSPSRSRSRSRSRSPADSYHSRRSSRGRSRSRSTSPKPRRRDNSFVSRTPSDRGRTGWGTPKGRYSMSPPSSLRSRGSRGARQRSLSSGSSSSSRSPSWSPERPRPKHRLPAATSIKDITLSISNTRMSGMLPPRDTDSHRTRKVSNGRRPSPSWSPEPPYPTLASASAVPSKRDGAHARKASPKTSVSDDAMLPDDSRRTQLLAAHPEPFSSWISPETSYPTSMVSSSAVFSKRDGARARKASITSVPDDAGDSRRAQPSAVHLEPFWTSPENPVPNDVMLPGDPRRAQVSAYLDEMSVTKNNRSHLSASNGHRVGTAKSAGFKPIGQTSSALKRFFPGDEEDVDHQALPSTHVKPMSPVVPDADLRPPEQKRDKRPRSSDDAQGRSRVLRDSPKVERHSRLQNMVGAPGGKRGSGTKDYHDRPVLPHPSLPRRPSLQENIPRAADLEVETRDPDIATPTLHMHSFDRDGPDSAVPPSPPSHGSRGDLYVIISQVGEGTFGKVYKARNTVTRVYVALKRIRMESERDGFPVTAMREIKLLQSLRHQNIVRLYEMMVSNGSVYMVFEYMDHDLTGILSQTQFSFTDAHLKSLCHQMLAGLAYLHHKGVIHRDIKGSNILINNRGELKLADFGLARFYQKRRRSDYTNRVITLWYRPPELLFGATVYGPEVDMWSAGCIMLELFTKKPVFQGNDEIHQLDVVYKILGTPVPERWPGLADLPWYELVKPREVIHDHFRELFQKWLSPAGLDLAERLLTYDPAQRVTAVDALKAPYFRQENPPAALPVGLSSLEGEWHELETKRERAKKRRKTEPTMP